MNGSFARVRYLIEVVTVMNLYHTSCENNLLLTFCLIIWNTQNNTGTERWKLVTATQSQSAFGNYFAPNSFCFINNITVILQTFCKCHGYLKIDTKISETQWFCTFHWSLGNLLITSHILIMNSKISTERKNAD